jgi:curved DNA-binding protein CbpA
MPAQGAPSASLPNPYRVLDVPRDADPATISRAYWHLAKQFHPDRNASALARRLMLVVNEAYEILKNPERRAAFDRATRPLRDAGVLSDPPPAPAPAAAASPAPPAARPVQEPVIEGPLQRRAARHRAEADPLGDHSGRGRTLEFGRYAGHTIAEVAAMDRDYLEWFIRTPLGRAYASEVIAATG